jgi:hypothetical protein
MVEFKTLASRWPNPNAARIAAIDAARMGSIAATFAVLDTPIPGPFMAVPDYAEVIVPDDATILTGCIGATRHPTCNDLSPFTFERATRAVTSATTSEPDWLVVDLSATATPVEPDFMRLRRLFTTFRGPVEVRYTSLFANGQTSTSYLFVRVKDPGT